MSSIKYLHERVGSGSDSAIEVLSFVINHFNPKSVLDIGCGDGAWLTTCKQMHIPVVYGVDGINVDSKLIDDSEFLLHDLRTELDLKRRFDIAMSLEVAEHLPAESADNIVQMLSKHSDVILFSAAIPGQGGQHHINEQWPEYWHKKFKAAGFVAYDIRDRFWNNEKVLWWYKQNLILFARPGNKDLADLTVSHHVDSRIHPGLYQKKIFHPKYIRSKTKLFRIVLSSLNYFFRSFFK
jgi:SAM-dependent methyltransferase